MRRDAVATIIEDADVPASRLEEWKAAEDERIDAEHAREVRILDVVHDVAKGAPDDVFLREGIIAPMLAEVSRHARSDERAVAEVKRARHREKRDPDARWGDEIEALRAWCDSGFASRLGDTGRALERGRTGASSSSSSRPQEPMLDDYLDAVRRALKPIEPASVAMLIAAYVELAPPRPRRNKEGKLRDGGETIYVDGIDPRDAGADRPGRADRVDPDDDAKRIGYAVRGVGLGFGGEASASAVALARATAEQPGAQSWPELVADRLGVTGDGAADRVVDAVRRAKKQLRDALRLVELDGEWRGVEANGEEHALTPAEGAALEAGRIRSVPRGAGDVAIARAWCGRPRFVIPPVAARERQRERAREAPGVMVTVCFGAPVVGGVRLSCEHADRPAEDAAALPHCETCGKPRAS